MVARAEVRIHPAVTSRNPSRGLSSRRDRRVTPIRARPRPLVAAAPARKYRVSPSAVRSEHTIGSRYAAPKNASICPRACTTASTRRPLVYGKNGPAAVFRTLVPLPPAKGVTFAGCASVSGLSYAGHTARARAERQLIAARFAGRTARRLPGGGDRKETGWYGRPTARPCRDGP